MPGIAPKKSGGLSAALYCNVDLSECSPAGLSHSPYYEHPLVLPQFRHL